MWCGWGTRSELPMQSLTCRNCAALHKHRSSLQGGSVPACRWTAPNSCSFQTAVEQCGFIPIFHAWSWLWPSQWALSHRVTHQGGHCGSISGTTLSMDNKRLFYPWINKEWMSLCSLRAATGSSLCLLSPELNHPTLLSLCYPLIVALSWVAQGWIFLQANAACFEFFSFLSHCLEQQLLTYFCLLIAAAIWILIPARVQMYWGCTAHARARPFISQASLSQPFQSRDPLTFPKKYLKPSSRISVLSADGKWR